MPFRGPADGILSWWQPILWTAGEGQPDNILGGGRDFGAFPGPGPFPHIISRNLTPDKTGLPEGGRTFSEFLEIMRTGTDFDQLQPTCTGAPNGNCLPYPFDGTRLQIMPWPIHRNMTDHDLRAIYEYLKAIPCIEGPPAPTYFTTIVSEADQKMRRASSTF